MKCTFLKWLPWSGKSHYASSLGVAVFNRDKARLDFPILKEEDIALLEQTFMTKNTDKDICIDNVHMSDKSLSEKIVLARSLWYEIEVVDMFDVICKGIGSVIAPDLYLTRCLEQNLKRDAVVPESVIYEMYLANYSYYYSEDDKVFICDIDWTLANLEHRLHFLEWEKKDHGWFYANVWWDSPIQPVIDVINQLTLYNVIILVSWRRNQTYRDTKNWLHKYGVKYDYLLMRWGWDRRPDTEVKESIYNKCLKNLNIVGVFDDRPSVVAKWRKLGLFVFNCQQGNKDF